MVPLQVDPRGPQGRRARRAVQPARRNQQRRPSRWSMARGSASARAVGTDVEERTIPRVEVVPSAALSRSGCRLKPAFQAVSAVKERIGIAVPPAARGGCRLKPALQAVSAVKERSGVRFRPAARGGCRLKPAFQAVSAVKERSGVRFRPPFGGRCRSETGAPGRGCREGE